MVEGPKVWLKKERLVVLQTLLLLRCESFQGIFKDSCDIFENALLEYVLCVGKELFMIFHNKRILRFHFGMNGAERIVRGKDVKPYLPLHSRKQLMFRMYFEDDTQVYFYDLSSLTLLPHTIGFDERLEAKLKQDCMSPSFSSQILLQQWDKKLQELQATSKPVVLQNLLLDQAPFPGVGNIIKCEALIRSRLNPFLLPSSLTAIQLSALIQEVQSYSQEWYRKGNKLGYAVYGRAACRLCARAVRLVRCDDNRNGYSGGRGGGSGDKKGRITYYCPSCQPMLGGGWEGEGSIKSNHHPSAQPIPHHTTPATAISSSSSSTTIIPQQYLPPLTLYPVPVCPRCSCRPPLPSIKNNLPPPPSTGLQRVRSSSSPNLHRLYYSCLSCRAFLAWADRRFPPCSCVNNRGINNHNHPTQHYPI